MIREFQWEEMNAALLKKRTLKVLVQRHFESLFNEMVHTWRKENNTTAQNYEIKCMNTEEMVDCGVTRKARKAQEQSEKSAKFLEKYPNLKFILVSPLKRCIETVDLTLKHSKGLKIEEIVAVDAFRERMDSNCDIPDKTRQLREEYRHVDFSFMDKFPIPDIWFVYTMAERHQKKFLSIAEDFLRKGGSSLGALKEIKDQFLVQIKAERPNGGEINSEMVRRAKKFKKRLVKEILELEKKKGARVENFEVLVCSHVKMILFVTATEFDESTQAPLGGRSLDNGEIIEWEIELPSGI